MSKIGKGSSSEPIALIEGEDSNAEEVEKKSYIWIYSFIFVFIIIVIFVIVWSTLPKESTVGLKKGENQKSNPAEPKQPETMEVDDSWCSGKATAKPGTNLSVKTSVSGSKTVTSLTS